MCSFPIRPRLGSAFPILAVVLAALLSSPIAAKRPTRLDALAASPAVRSLAPEAASPAFVREGSVVQAEPRLGVPTFVWAAPRPVPSGVRGPEDAARRYLADFAPLYRLDARDAAAASVRLVHDTGRGVVIVKIREEVEGIDVFREEMSVAMRRDLSLISLSGYLSGAPARAGRSLAKTYRLGPREAIAAAYEEMEGETLGAGELRSAGERRGPYESFELVARSVSGRALSGGARIKRVLFHLPDRFVPSYYVELDVCPDESTGSDMNSFVVSGQDGAILFRNDLTASDSFAYRVWAETGSPHRPFDGPQGNSASPHPTGVPNGYQPPFVAPNLVTLENGPIGTNDPWLPSGSTTTVGNNVDAYADLASPDGFGTGDYRASTTSSGVFDRTYDTARPPNDSQGQILAATTQLFFDVNFLHDWFYDPGFDEASGNAQQSNYGRGGLESDRIRAEAQDYGGTNNANMSTPSDGGSPRMQMYVWTANLAANVTATPPGSTYVSGKAAFGPQSFDTTGSVVLVSDVTAPVTDACQPIWNGVSGRIALIDRGTCTYKQKAVYAQAAGAIGAIIVNNTTGSAPYMPDGSPSGTITIPVLSVTETDGASIKSALLSGAVSAHLYRETGPDRDGTIDNTIVAHEWGHYISNRLVGDANGLGNNQGGGMGEGWGDFHALLMIVRPEDTVVPSNASFNGVYGLIGYVAGGNAPGGGGNNAYYWGIRRYPYSTDLTKNPLTFQHISDGVPLPAGVPTSGFGSSYNSEVHNTGEVWANMLWECYASILRDTLGATPRLTFDQAQQRMRDYLVAGYKLTPADPTFVEARDALLAAVAAGDATDYTLCSHAFARRGLGLRAVAPDRYSTDNTGVVESYVAGNDLAFVSATLDDAVSSCDADGVLDDAETGNLTITLRNVGTEILAATSATISSSNAAVSFPSGTTVSFPSSQPMQTTTASIPVRLDLGVGIQELDFDIAYRDPGFSIAGDVTLTRSYRVNTDELPAYSKTDTVECASTPWVPDGSPAYAAASGFERIEVTALDHRWLGPDPFLGPTDQFLVSPTLHVSATGSFGFTFRHRYSFEYNAAPTYFDGGVIEISTDGGTGWTDIGSAATPGYNGTLSMCCSNPLGGRSAYAHANASYPSLDTVSVNLGTAYQGAAVNVRFRVGADEFSGGAGWEIDDLSFTGIDDTPFPLLVVDQGLCLEPGGVPETGAAGTPLTLRKNAGNPALIDLSWGASCGTDVGGYAVYEGVLGSFYGEIPLICGLSGTLLAGQAPGAGSRYYLVAPLSSLKTDKEGSHGSGVSGERPLGPSACRTVLDTRACR
jgi:large repetitive protein